MAAGAPPTISLGFQFSDDRVVSRAYDDPAGLFDYELVLWRSGGFPDLFHSGIGAPEAYEGLPSLSHDDSGRLKRAVDRRTQEMEEFLGLGRTLVIFVSSPEEWYFDTGERTRSGTGRNQKVTHLVDRMTTAEVLPLELDVQAATGRSIKAVGGEPFATFWRAHGEMFGYRGYFRASHGTTLAVIEGTDKAVAAVAQVGGGTVVLLPELLLLPGDEFNDTELSDNKFEEGIAETHGQLLDGLFEYLRQLSVGDADAGVPDWANRVLVTDEAEQRDTLDAAQTQLREASQKVELEAQRYSRIRQRKLLFTASGASLERVVAEALQALGCEVTDGPLHRTDRIIRRGEDVAVVEIKGKGRSAAEKDAAQLEKWVSEYLQEHEARPKAILVVNAWRGTPLAERTGEAFPDQMLRYSEGREHCLITGLQLLGAQLEAIAHPERRDEIWASIRDCVGRYPRYEDWRTFLTGTPADDAPGPSTDPVT